MSINIGYYAVPGLRKGDLFILKQTFRRIDLEDIITEVAEATGIPVKSIKGARREVPYVKARHIYFYLSKRHTNHSLKVIGDSVGRDHTTVIHGINNIKNYLETEEDMREIVSYIQERISSTVKNNQ